MTEAFLHYLWQHRLFDNTNLRSDDGCPVEIVKPGHLNTDAGPDFFNAQLRIDGMLWSGNVEIHIHASDWRRHNHHNDPSYDSCILHVVYVNDTSTLRMDGTRIPAIELKNRFQAGLWDNYLKLIGTHGWVSCQQRLNEISDQTKNLVFDRMIAERMEEKCKMILISLKGNKDDWEECFYQYLSRNFGFQLNAMPFEMLARSLPLKYIRKEGDFRENIEALLFGQAGMLNNSSEDEYEKKLAIIYSHLAKKYSLKNIPFSAWKFLRLRPVNFPAVRIAQLSAILWKSTYLFELFSEAGSLNKISAMLSAKPSDYWNTHYHFGKAAGYKEKKIGETSVNNILINTCIPFLYAFGKYNGNRQLSENAIVMLKELAAEENHLISKWKETGMKASSAYDSQALLQLKIVHCSEKKCLTCIIGNQLINRMP